MAKILNTRKELWGIDVDVLFDDARGTSRIVTMRFDSEKQIELELQSRVNRIILMITEKRKEVSGRVVTAALLEKTTALFEKQETITKAEYTAILESSVTTIPMNESIGVEVMRG